MIRYVPTSGVNVAESLTAALWSLARPPAVRSAADVTSRMFPLFTALNGSVWMATDTEFSILVHRDAELSAIADILQPWIDDGNLPANTNKQLVDLIAHSKGAKLVVWDAIPQLFKAQSKTKEELISVGLMVTI